MAGPNSLADIQELVSPIKPYIRGICALVHDVDEFDEGFRYLVKTNMELGAGNILIGTYLGRHDYSRTRILYETGMKNGDWFVQIDCGGEIFGSKFGEVVGGLIEHAKENDLNSYYFYGKPFLIKFCESLEYRGTPHENLIRKEGEIRGTELSDHFTEEQLRVNIRPLKRPKTHFLRHYVLYILQPCSNQNALGLEHHGGAAAFPKLENIRLRLVKYLRDNGFERTPEGFGEALKKGLNDELRYLINNHKQLNDYYRFYVLGDDSVNDSHNWSNIHQF